MKEKLVLETEYQQRKAQLLEMDEKIKKLQESTERALDGLMRARELTGNRGSVSFSSDLSSQVHTVSHPTVLLLASPHQHLSF